MKTYAVKLTDIKRERHVIDASGKILGRLATDVAKLLMGKHKPVFSRNADTGDDVVVINAAQIRFTGDKGRQKMYYRHSGYPGGFRAISLDDTMKIHPTYAIEHAVKGMLPRNRMGDQMMRKLKVYAGEAPSSIVGPGAGETKSSGEKV